MIAPSSRPSRAGRFLAALFVTVLRLWAAPLPTTLEDFHQPGAQPSYFGPELAIQTPTTCRYPTVEKIFQWEGSMMAHASIDPLFEACLAIAEQDAPGSGDLCMRCHIPKAWVAWRSTPTSGSAVQAEDRIGVGCAVCHRMVNPLWVDDESPDPDLAILSKLAGKGEQPQTYGNGMYVIDPFTPYSKYGFRAPRAKTPDGEPA